jgi:hypothetical protein
VRCLRFSTASTPSPVSFCKRTAIPDHTPRFVTARLFPSKVIAAALT